MKKKRTLVKSVKGLFALTLLTFMTSVDAQQVRYKMTTDIPASITTPDSVKTSLGMLRFFDGFPDGATVQKLYDNLDFQRGVQAFLTALPSASMYATREGYRTFGPDNQTVKDFWSIIAYDHQTRSMHQTDQQFPSTSSQKQDIIINPDPVCGSLFWTGSASRKRTQLVTNHTWQRVVGNAASLGPTRAVVRLSW